jgi:hypothetical protein
MKDQNENLLEETYNLIVNEIIDAPKKARDILANPNKPTGTLPYSLEALLDALGHWGQHGHPRKMDPEIEELAVALTKLINKKSKSRIKIY